MHTMAINRGSAVEDDEDEQESAKTLRTKLERALVENRTLKAEKILSAGTYDLVKPEDLAKVDTDKLEEAAQTLQSERVEIQKGLVRDTFAKRGLDGDDLDAAVADFLGGPPSEEDTLDRIGETASIGGNRPALVNATKLTGVAAIEAGLLANEKRRTRK